MINKKCLFLSLSILTVLSSCSKSPESLLIASKNGNVKEVVELINEGYDIEYTGKNSLRPLHLASYYGHVDVINELLINGAEESATAIQGQTPLIFAVKSGNIDAVRMLLKHKVNINHLAENGTAFAYALHSRKYDICDLLVEKGADINKNNGTLPLAYLFVNKLAPLKYLISRGFNINKPCNDKAKDNILIHLCRQIKFEKDLRKEKSKYKFLVTPISTYLDIIRLLIKEGININYLNSYKYTAMDIAIEINNQEVIGLLRKHGAQTSKELKGA